MKHSSKHGVDTNATGGHATRSMCSELHTRTTKAAVKSRLSTSSTASDNNIKNGETKAQRKRRQWSAQTLVIIVIVAVMEGFTMFKTTKIDQPAMLGGIMHDTDENNGDTRDHIYSGGEQRHTITGTAIDVSIETPINSQLSTRTQLGKRDVERADIQPAKSSPAPMPISTSKPKLKLKPTPTPMPLDTTYHHARSSSTGGGGDRMPQLILHVGPSKTATTTMQGNLAELQMNGILAQDNYIFWGRGYFKGQYKGHKMSAIEGLWNASCMHLDYTNYLNQKTRTEFPNNTTAFNTSNMSNTSISVPSRRLLLPVPQCIRSTQNLLDELRNDAISLIISDETYSWRSRYHKGALYNPVFFDNLNDVFHGWNVTVVMTYRRVFDWMLSSIKQDKGRNIERGREDGKWPSDGGKLQLRTWSMITEALRWCTLPKDGRKDSYIVTSVYTFIDGSIQTWGNGGFAYHVLNVHNKQRHITQQLMCDFVQDAPNACAYLQNMTDNPPLNMRNVAWFCYHDIVFMAAKRGFISQQVQANKTRVDMANDLAQYHQRTLNKTMVDLPLWCPSNTSLEHLLNISLAVEANWMPAWFRSPNGEVQHRSSFERTAYQRREFCSVDFHRLLKNVSSWDEILEKLENGFD